MTWQGEPKTGEGVGEPSLGAVTGAFTPSAEELERARRAVTDDLGPRYEVRGFLGRGGYATVWRAHDRLTGEDLALKRFDDRGDRPRGFYRELSVLFRLQHDRIARILNLLEAPGGRYLVLEYCAGGNLRAALSRARRAGQTCPPARARELALQTAEALEAAHRLGIVHRDVKPENMLFAAEDAGPFGGASPLKLADFGLARVLQSGAGLADSPARLSGSPAYMAPEQFGGAYGPASDVYALAVVLYELWHGRPPFLGSPEEIAYGHLRRPPEISPDLPAPGAAWLAAALQKDPAGRPPLGEWADALRRAPAGQAATAARPAGPGVTTFRPPLGAFKVMLRPEPDGTSSVVTVSSEGVDWWAPDGTRRRPPLALPNLSRVMTGPGATFWAARGREVWRVAPDAGPQAVLTVPDLVEGLEGGAEGADDDRLAVVAAGRVLEFAPACGPYPCWGFPHRQRGLPPCLARLPDGRLAVAEGPLRPRLIILSRDGRLTAAVPLPGICWGLGLWPAAGRLYARVLIRDSFRAVTLRTADWAVEPLAGEDDVLLLAAPRSGPGGLCGLRSDGRAVHWEPDGRRREFEAGGPAASGFRSLAADGRFVAVLTRDPAGSLVAVHSC